MGGEIDVNDKVAHVASLHGRRIGTAVFIERLHVHCMCMYFLRSRPVGEWELWAFSRKKKNCFELDDKKKLFVPSYERKKKVVVFY